MAVLTVGAKKVEVVLRTGGWTLVEVVTVGARRVAGNPCNGAARNRLRPGGYNDEVVVRRGTTRVLAVAVEIEGVRTVAGAANSGTVMAWLTFGANSVEVVATTPGARNLLLVIVGEMRVVLVERNGAVRVATAVRTSTCSARSTTAGRAARETPPTVRAGACPERLTMAGKASTVCGEEERTLRKTIREAPQRAEVARVHPGVSVAVEAASS